jgi:large subunit ribosomal protein L16
MSGSGFSLINLLLLNLQEVRMGKGKGNPEGWAAVVQPGRILFEADGVSDAGCKEAFELAAQKLPIKTKFVVRHDYLAYQESKAG